METMEERWLYLEKETKEKIRDLAFNLTNLLGDNWDFSGHVPGKEGGNCKKPYELKDAFQDSTRLRDVKLVIGQEIMGGPHIRFAFYQEQVFADYLKKYSEENYKLVNGIFQRVFNTSIPDYRPQDIVDQKTRRVKRL